VEYNIGEESVDSFLTSQSNHMQTSNAELMRTARESLKGKWGLAIAVTVVYCVLVSVPQSIKNIGPIVVLLISAPLAGGMAAFALSIARNQEAKFEQLFDGFKSYATYLVAYILMTVYIMLWMLLLIIPGIIAAFSYSMTYFIIADDPSISASDALKKSKEIMKGNKGKYFVLSLGMLWIMPYMQISFAKFYEDIKEKNVIPQEASIPTPAPAPTDVPEPAGSAGIITEN
jgi:uncharacterized membrane protein